MSLLRVEVEGHLSGRVVLQAVDATTDNLEHVLAQEPRLAEGEAKIVAAFLRHLRTMHTEQAEGGGARATRRGTVPLDGIRGVSC